MFNFKTLLASAAIAVIGLVATEAGYARTTCDQVGRYSICQTDNGDYGTDHIGVYIGQTNVAFMNVICTGGGGNRWEGERNSSYVSYDDMQALANNWCRNY